MDWCRSASGNQLTEMLVHIARVLLSGANRIAPLL